MLKVKRGCERYEGNTYRLRHNGKTDGRNTKANIEQKKKEREI